MTDLDRELERIARSPVLLVASDYDGTMAPIVSDPDKALPQRESIVALRRHVGIVYDIWTNGSEIIAIEQGVVVNA